MTCAYCGGRQREERNPNRCWGCGAAVSGHQSKIYIDSQLLQQLGRVVAGSIYAVPTYSKGPLGDKIFMERK